MTLTEGFSRTPSFLTDHLLRVHSAPAPEESCERGHRTGYSTGQLDLGPWSEILLISQLPPPLSTPYPVLILQGPAPTSSIPEVSQEQPLSPPARPPGAYKARDSSEGKKGHPGPSSCPRRRGEHVGSPKQWKDRQARMEERGR